MDAGRVTRRRGGPNRRREIDLDDAIYGVHAVEESLFAREQLRRLHVSKERARDPALRRVLEAARERGIDVRFEPREYFDGFPYKAHQGVVAFGPPFPYVTLDEVLARRGAGPLLLLVLDHITDPHNVGATVRTAEGAGCQGVVIPERRAAGVNATVRKAAAGAAAHIPIARVANIAEAIRKLKKANVWVAGAAADPQAMDYAEADLRGDLAFVIGAEGHGLSPLVKRECDYLVRVPMHGKIESLNASVAAAVLLYEAVRQRGKGVSAP